MRRMKFHVLFLTMLWVCDLISLSMYVCSVLSWALIWKDWQKLLQSACCLAQVDCPAMFSFVDYKWKQIIFLPAQLHISICTSAHWTLNECIRASLCGLIDNLIGGRNCSVWNSAVICALIQLSSQCDEMLYGAALTVIDNSKDWWHCNEIRCCAVHALITG